MSNLKIVPPDNMTALTRTFGYAKQCIHDPVTKDLFGRLINERGVYTLNSFTNPIKALLDDDGNPIDDPSIELHYSWTGPSTADNAVMVIIREGYDGEYLLAYLVASDNSVEQIDMPDLSELMPMDELLDHARHCMDPEEFRSLMQPYLG